MSQQRDSVYYDTLDTAAEEGLLKLGQPEDLVEKKNDSSGAGVTTFGLVAVGFFWVSGAQFIPEFSNLSFHLSFLSHTRWLVRQ